MKKIVLLGSLAGLLTACTNRSATDSTQTADSARVESITATTASTMTIPARLDSLGLTADHDWRQVNVGDDYAAVKQTEVTPPFEQDASHVGYSKEFSNLESVDYQYFQRGNKVTGIEVDLYLNTAKSAKAYRQDLLSYLTARYGPATTSGRTSAWPARKVVLTDLSAGKDYGLKLTIGR